MLLAVPVLAALGRDGVGLARSQPVVILYLLFASLLLFPSLLPHVNLLSLVLVAVAIVYASMFVSRPAGDVRYATD
jgi:hypothetical protein